jgi:hypothetical protein
MCGVRVLGLAIAPLLASCALSEVHIRESGLKLLTVTRGVMEGAVLRDTADGCAVDLFFTNPFGRRMRVIVTYRAVDADEQELAVLRVAGVIDGRATTVFHGESSPGL